MSFGSTSHKWFHFSTCSKASGLAKKLVQCVAKYSRQNKWLMWLRCVQADSAGILRTIKTPIKYQEQQRNIR